MVRKGYFARNKHAILPNFNDADDQFALEPTDMREEDSSQNPDHRVRVAIRALRKMQQQLENVLDMLERGGHGAH